MLVEMWKDVDGYRLTFGDSEFALSPIAYKKLIDSLSEFEDQDVTGEEGMYESLQLDLEDDNGE